MLIFSYSSTVYSLYSVLVSCSVSLLNCLPIPYPNKPPATPDANTIPIDIRADPVAAPITPPINTPPTNPMHAPNSE